MVGLAILLISVIIGANALPDVNTEWQAFKAEYGKSYSKAEDSNRKLTFARTLEQIASHNKLYEQGLVSYTLGLNKFADISEDEFKKTHMGYKKSTKYSDKLNLVEFEPPQDAEIPDEFDWRDLGAVTPIKDQRSCGSCWTFSATGALEGQYFLKTGKLASLSEQNLVDCSTNDDNEGCNGGDMPPAFIYVHNNDGIDSQESYPYTGYDGSCKYTEEGNVTSTSATVVQVKIGNEEDLKVAVATLGPIAVAIDASQWDFSYYSGGVYYNKNCISGDSDPMELDHAVLLVGYGQEDGIDYWLIKNSWGTSWGENGYMKASRNRNNNCGIASEAVVPILY